MKPFHLAHFMIRSVLPISMVLVMTGSSVKIEKSKKEYNPPSYARIEGVLEESKLPMPEEQTTIDLLKDVIFSFKGENPVKQEEVESLLQVLSPKNEVMQEIAPFLLEAVLSNEHYTIHSSEGDFMLGSIYMTIDKFPGKQYYLSITTGEHTECISFSTNFIDGSYLTFSYLVLNDIKRERFSLDGVSPSPFQVLYSNYDVESGLLSINQLRIEEDDIHFEIPRQMKPVLLRQMVQDYQTEASKEEILLHYQEISHGIIPGEKEYVKTI